MDAAQRAPTRRRRGAGQRQRARQGFRRRPAGRSMRRSCATTFHESWHGMALAGWPPETTPHRGCKKAGRPVAAVLLPASRDEPALWTRHATALQLQRPARNHGWAQRSLQLHRSCFLLSSPLCCSFVYLYHVHGDFL
ncbi:hypothetical protein PVAP13_6NG264032 [Panicum virgatum]|uniref:Uncharacterized protein n=1 Tax=Panicum virgatum TaxID=38727 RepID=A0A8T0R1X0_PANVG|nr:hypothetical protein PVAP13_6NG264032 [Panicum virgatum]